MDETDNNTQPYPASYSEEMDDTRTSSYEFSSEIGDTQLPSFESSDTACKITKTGNGEWKITKMKNEETPRGPIEMTFLRVNNHNPDDVVRCPVVQATPVYDEKTGKLKFTYSLQGLLIGKVLERSPPLQDGTEEAKIKFDKLNLQQ
jgi:hypothetical protein